MLTDGLTDPFSKKHMGEIAEDIALKFMITREQQDEYAVNSYTRAKFARDGGMFLHEICPVNGINTDEQIDKVNFDKLRKLKPVFRNDGTITAGNASALSDGASIILLACEEYVKKNNIVPKYEILAYDQTVGNPNEFPYLPVISIRTLVNKCHMRMEDIDIFEINEAFSLIPLLCSKELGIPMSKINLYGGGVSLGHPIGCSGNRIITTLCNILTKEEKKYGIASICNGGGGATTILLKKC
jgi:acetyl-CoA C-acetyltransferase